MNVQATGIAAMDHSFRNSARLHYTLRFWPEIAKLSRQDAATATRQDVLTRESVLQSIGLRRAEKPRCLAGFFACRSPYAVRRMTGWLP